jgi:beta-phosphoglucomutase family hydrolase
MQPSIRAVLWDMDGTLADTGELHFRTWRDALQGMGVDLDFEVFRTTFGMNNYDILEKVLGHAPSLELVERITQEKEVAYRQLLPGKISLLPGVKDWLDWLRAHSYPQAIASSAPPENIEAFVDELHLRDYFGALVSGYGMPGKPAPDVFLLAASKLGVPPMHCLVIEDAIAGVQAACRAGMACLAVTTTNPPSALSQADLVVEDLSLVDPEKFIFQLDR